MIERVLEQQRRDLGGFEVGRVLPQASRRMVGPFVFFDHMGPVDFPAGIPRSVDVRPHPHIGLSTLTYLFEGEIMHRDSIGSEQAIRPGEVNWMTAGRGVTHSERFERARAKAAACTASRPGSRCRARTRRSRRASHYDAAALPRREGPGLLGRLVAGEAFGARAPVKTHSPLFYAHWQLARGARGELPDEYAERALYVAQGAVEVGHQTFHTGQMPVFSPGAHVAVSAVEPAVVMVLGGEPLGERFLEWNFVSSSRERIEQAKADWRAKRMKLPDLDDGEFIPLPGDPQRSERSPRRC